MGQKVAKLWKISFFLLLFSMKALQHRIDQQLKNLYKSLSYTYPEYCKIRDKNANYLLRVKTYLLGSQFFLVKMAVKSCESWQRCYV
jgi:hypothetical protein